MTATSFISDQTLEQALSQAGHNLHGLLFVIGIIMIVTAVGLAYVSGRFGSGPDWVTSLINASIGAIGALLVEVTSSPTVGWHVVAACLAGTLGTAAAIEIVLLVRRLQRKNV